MIRIVLGLLFSFFLLAAVEGCQQNQPRVAPAEPPVVPVSKPVSRMITEFVDFTGRTNAVNSVNIIPRVTGYLVKIPFREGSEVQVNDLLFEIDPRPYQAQFEAAKAKQSLSQASLKLAQVTNVRFKVLAKKEPGAVSQQDLDKYQAMEDEAVANLNLAKANLDAAQLSLNWTKVTSPIEGKVSRHLLTLGNLVNADQTLLTTVVSLDPMFAYFDMDEPTYLRIQRAINEGRINFPGERDEIPVMMGVQGEEGYPHEGGINFVDNQLFPTTGSITWRGLFANPKPPGGTRLLAPGMFVRIRLPIGQPHQAFLVIDRAVWSDQGLKNVYVIDSENKVVARRVTTGPLEEDGLRVVEGLKPDDWVVVGGLQEIRPRLQIRAEQIPMPTLIQPVRVQTPKVPAPKTTPKLPIIPSKKKGKG